MNNNSKLFSDWSEVTSVDRNRLVFEGLNKSYGAYEIRTNYDRTLLKAFSAMGLFILLTSTALLVIPAIPLAVIVIDEGQIPPMPKPKEYTEYTPPKTPAPAPPKTNSNIFYKPEVQDSVPELDSIPLLVLNSNHGTGDPKDTSTTTDPLIGAPKPPDRGLELPPDTILDFVSERPEFPGGDDGLFRFLQANAHIPEPIKEIGRVSEKVGVVFVINKEGSVTDATLLRGGCKYWELNKEALRVINKMPKWEPGRQNGNKVKVRMILPIRFEVKS